MSSGSEKPAFLQIRVLCACFPMLPSCWRPSSGRRTGGKCCWPRDRSEQRALAGLCSGACRAARGASQSCPTLVLADGGVEILTGITGGSDTTQIILSQRYREKAGTLETRAVLRSFLCHFPSLCGF